MAVDPIMWVTEGAAPMQGTVLIKNAEELEGYSRSEEDRLEALIKGIADSGARVLITFCLCSLIGLHLTLHILQPSLLQIQINRGVTGLSRGSLLGH